MTWKNRLRPAMRIAVVSLLASVVLGCSTCKPEAFVRPSVYRPPAELMLPAPAQYLLPETQQRRE